MGNAYDHEPRSNPGMFLRLTSKDQSVQIRLASEPYREPQVWKESGEPPLEDEKTGALTEDQWARIMGDPDYRLSERYSWIVIDRDDGKARLFSGTPSVYKNIKAYAQMDEWGDPTQYDFKITRTEEPGRNYYAVIAMPNKAPITDREALAAEAIDVRTLVPNARLTTDEQIDHISDEYQGTPQTKVDKPVVPDVVITDIGDEPISLDDIPF